MSKIIALIGFIVLFALILGGMPVAFALCITGCLGMIVTIGFTGTMTQLGLVPYASVASYVVSIIPLFALMGNLAFVSGLVIDVYRAGDKWLGALPGGLAMGSIAGCTGFAAVSGSSVAAVGMLAESALPEMLRYKYAPKLATGCIAAGATLGILIPPSGPMVVYGLLSEASIGKLFMAGIVPGLCLAFLYLILIYVSCRLKPEMGPRGPKSTLREKLLSLVNAWPAILLAGAVLGGIWGGVFTPIEAAGVGAFLAMIITLIRKKLTMNTLLDALTSSIRVSTMIFTMFIGATLFSYFLTSTGVPKQIGDYLASLSVPPTVILSCIMLVYFIYGCIMDEAGLLMISLPIFLPIVKAIGVDLIAFGVLVMIVMGTGMTTPPVGLNVFIVSGIVKEKGISMSTIYQGVLPFVGAMVIMIALLIAFPQIALSLPNLMIGN